MAKYINAEDFREKAFYADTDADIARYVHEYGYADVAPVVHGKWVISDLTAYCSNCNCANRHIPIIAGRRGIYFSRGSKPPFCEKCGAKMDKE